VNPRINVRNLPRPQRWGSAKPEMSWHHIIPSALLGEVWNRLVDQHIATQLAEARVAIRQYLLLADSKLPKLDELIDRIRAENIDQRRSSHNSLRPLEVAEANQLAVAATWPAWNAVEGPKARSDDPGDWYLDRFTAGITPEEAARMKAIEGLFHRLQAFVNAGPTPGPITLRDLAQSVSAARPNVCCDLPIRYRPEMWVRDGVSLWRKRRDGERYTP
jgi:hypothetical protein